jgi:hypothetical protein
MRTVNIKTFNCFPDGISVRNDSLILQKKLAIFNLHPAASDGELYTIEIASSPGSFVVHNGGKPIPDVYIDSVGEDPSIKPAQFRLLPSKTHTNASSFELCLPGRSGFFLRHSNRKIEVSTVADGGKEFANDSAFYVNDVGEQLSILDTSANNSTLVIPKRKGPAAKGKMAKAAVESDSSDDVPPPKSSARAAQKVPAAPAPVLKRSRQQMQAQQPSSSSLVSPPPKSRKSHETQTATVSSPQSPSPQTAAES